MKTLRSGSRTFWSDLDAFCRTSGPVPEAVSTVAGILADVRDRGDAAIVDQAARIDGMTLGPGRFRVSSREVKAALRRLDPTQRKAIEAARENVIAFNRRGLPRDWFDANRHGAAVGERHHPLRRVGINVPGGQVPLISTVVMTVTLAAIAGVSEVVVFTPAKRDGKVSGDLLAVLHLCGATEIYRFGGVYGVGAMAYGTKTIPPVDKVFGPSNAYVCEAMRQVFGVVGVAGLPGPSELMVIADRTARRDFAAADLLGQAEHGSGKERVFLVADSRKIIDGVTEEIIRQIETLGRKEEIQRVLNDGYLAVEVSNLDEAVGIANYVAPEHLQLMVEKGRFGRLLKTITTAGAIMLGNETPTVLGDFVAGPSHVLPTGRTGRFFSGLRVSDFMRRTSVFHYDGSALKKAAPTVRAFSAMEHLDAHGRSLEIRM